MANPAKILAFLDVTGRWDPSLAFVMFGAIAVGAFAFAIARRRTASALGLPMQLPAARSIDARLVVGSLLFGVGWGIAGFCPGPAIVALGAAHESGRIHGCDVAGMGLFEIANATGNAASRRCRTQRRRDPGTARMQALQKSRPSDSNFAMSLRPTRRAG
jgi:hypothetical protein